MKGGKADEKVEEKVVEGEYGEAGLTTSAEGVKNGEKKEVKHLTSETNRINKNSDGTINPTVDTKINLICKKTVETREKREDRRKMNGNGSKMVEEEGEEGCQKNGGGKKMVEEGEERCQKNGGGKKIVEEEGEGRNHQESLSPALISTLESFLHRKVRIKSKISY